MWEGRAHIHRYTANPTILAKTLFIFTGHEKPEYSVEIVLGLPGRQATEAKPETWHSICGVEMDLIGYEAADPTATARGLVDVNLST